MNSSSNGIQDLKEADSNEARQHKLSREVASDFVCSSASRKTCGLNHDGVVFGSTLRERTCVLSRITDVILGGKKGIRWGFGVHEDLWYVTRVSG